MNDDYFYYTNKDINNIILCYLDYDSFIKFSINYEELIDYFELFIIKYWKYYRRNVKDYNIKQIYLGFLVLESTNKLKNIRYTNEVPEVIKDNIDVNKYLICDHRSLPSNLWLRRL